MMKSKNKERKSKEKGMKEKQIERQKQAKMAKKLEMKQTNN